MRNVSLAEVDGTTRAVLPIATDYARGYLLDWHQHRRAQLLCTATGAMAVETGDGAWMVPADRAVLIPPRTRHRVRMLDASTRSLYLEPAAVPWWPPRCTVVPVTPLLAELLGTAADFPVDYDLAGRDGTVVDLILYELAALTPLPLHVRMPGPADLAALCREYLARPDAGVSNADWARRLNASERAFTRRFRAETGLAPAAWRTRARLLAAVPLLRRYPVTEVAVRIGYATPAAFTAAFSRAFGFPPSRLTRHR